MYYSIQSWRAKTPKTGCRYYYERDVSFILGNEYRRRNFPDDIPDILDRSDKLNLCVDLAAQSICGVHFARR